MLRLLIDGRWVPLRDAKVRVGLLIPPGPAVRSFTVKEEHRRFRYGPRARGEPTLKQKIQNGRVNMVAHAFNSLMKGYLETQRTIDGVQVRICPDRLQQLIEERGITPLPAIPDLPPDLADLIEEPAQSEVSTQQGPVCQQCGLYVADKTKHDEFHRSHSGPPAAAFFCEDQIRGLLADTVAVEVGAALDEFQAGLERYLEGWFADLTGARRRRRRQDDAKDAPCQSRT